MAELILQDMRNGYIELFRWLAEEGEAASPRGEATREITGARIILENPVDGIPLGVGRKLNKGIGAAETAQLLSGISDAEQLVAVSHGKFSRFMNGEVLRGAYGPRVAPQLANVVARLAQDPETRQAVASVWQADELAITGTADVPCTVSLHWMIRGGRLHAFTHMRSNDAWLGVPYDFWMFTRLQMTLAWVLGVPPGRYIHTADSFHVYERDLHSASNLAPLAPPLEAPGGPFSFTNPDLDLIPPASLEDALRRLRDAQSWASDAVFGERIPGSRAPTPENAQWYVKELWDYRTAGGVYCPECSYVRSATSDTVFLGRQGMGICGPCTVVSGSGRLG